MSIATEITALTTDRNNIRTALASKGVSAGSHGFDDFAGDISGISVGVDIHGVVEQHKVKIGNQIYTGDFVQFSDTTAENQWLGFGGSYVTNLPDKVLKLTSSKAVVIADNIFFLLDIDSTNYTFTVVQKATGPSYANFRDVTLLSGNRLLATYFNSNNVLWSYIISIDVVNNTISFGTAQRNSYDRNGDSASVAVLDDTYVMSVFSIGDASTRRFAGKMFTYSGTNVDPNGTSFTTIDSSNASGIVAECVKIDDSHVFAVNYTNAYVITVNKANKTFTAASTSHGKTISFAKIAKLSNNKFLLVYTTGSSSGVFAMVATVSGTSISFGTETVLFPASQGFQNQRFELLAESDSKVTIMIFRSAKDGQTYNAEVHYEATISGTSISLVEIGPEVFFQQNTTCVFCKFSDEIYLFGNRGTAQNYASCAIKYSGVPFAEPYSTTINGVAKTGGSGGSTIDIYVPNS